MIRFPVKKQRFYLFYMSRHPERQEAAVKLSLGSEWNREVQSNKNASGTEIRSRRVAMSFNGIDLD
ncbi:MAG: hypothetical protein ACIAZJ_14735 [Gimesia chilikensis]|uniref:hypothetical protein n=1 Tax=Gimesia chilikensis TaxID=2605989 RepID=UPI00378BC2CA